MAVKTTHQRERVSTADTEETQFIFSCGKRLRSGEMCDKKPLLATAPLLPRLTLKAVSGSVFVCQFSIGWLYRLRDGLPCRHAPAANFAFQALDQLTRSTWTHRDAVRIAWKVRPPRAKCLRHRLPGFHVPCALSAHEGV